MTPPSAPGAGRLLAGLLLVGCGPALACGNTNGGGSTASASGSLGGSSGGSSGGASTASGTSAAGTGAGSSSGAAGTSGSVGGNTAGASGGSSGGLLDSGCGPIAEFGACVLDLDCGCGARCLNTGTARACATPCSSDRECGDGGLHCDKMFGLCDYGAACTAGSGFLRFQPCAFPVDCACPLSCFADQSGVPLCEAPCTADQQCAADEYCNLQSGSCQQLCQASVAAVDHQRCLAGNGDCGCPLRCIDDRNFGEPLCERPCQSDADCRGDDAGSECDRYVGACTSIRHCSSTLTTPLFAPCLNNADCACPQTCALDATLGRSLCELCDGGACGSPVLDTGHCQVASGEAALYQAPNTPCASNADCLCPASCGYLGLDDGGLPRGVCGSASGCATDGDCEDPATRCDVAAHACVAATCPPTGALSCPIDGQPNGGNCLRFSDAAHYGCVAGGLATASCSIYAGRHEASSLCAPGLVCVSNQPDGSGSCQPLCSNGAPTSAAPSCAAGSHCFSARVTDLRSMLQTPTAVLANPNSACFLVSDAGCLLGLPTNWSGQPGPGQVGWLCNSALDCACPYQCAPNGACGLPCAQDLECGDPDYACLAGVCAREPFPVTSFTPGQPCVPGQPLADAGPFDGTIVQVLQPNLGVHELLVCRANGDAGPNGSCAPAGSRRRPRELCPAGTSCTALGDGGGQCAQPCANANDTSSCPNTEICLATAQQYLCGTSDPTQGCAAGGLGGGKEFDLCVVESDCACPLDCVSEPGFPSPLADQTEFAQGAYCEQPCATNADCAKPYEVCGSDGGVAPHCTLNFCGPLADVGQVDPGRQVSQADRCDVDGVGDGTCLSLPSFHGLYNFPDAGGPGAIGLCVKAGTATRGCDPQAGRADGAALCIAGEVCDTSGPTAQCRQGCALSGLPSAPTCPAGTLCGLPFPAAGFNAASGRCLPVVDGGPAGGA